MKTFFQVNCRLLRTKENKNQQSNGLLPKMAAPKVLPELISHRVILLTECWVEICELVDVIKKFRDGSRLLF
jgi:hypothetical protein